MRRHSLSKSVRLTNLSVYDSLSVYDNWDNTSDPGLSPSPPSSLTHAHRFIGYHNPNWHSRTMPARLKNLSCSSHEHRCLRGSGLSQIGADRHTRTAGHTQICVWVTLLESRCVRFLVVHVRSLRIHPRKSSYQRLLLKQSFLRVVSVVINWDVLTPWTQWSCGWNKRSQDNRQHRWRRRSAPSSGQ